MEKRLYDAYLSILHEELLPALGCTEPIAVAYAAALARKTLGHLPSRVEIGVSGNILKNVKSVVVPNTGGLKGVVSAAAAGIVAGDADAKLQVLSSLTENDRDRIAAYEKAAEFVLRRTDSPCIFDIQIRVCNAGDDAYVRIEGHHTNVVTIERNGRTLARKDVADHVSEPQTDRTLLNIRDIVEFVRTASFADLEDAVRLQTEYNAAIAREGLRGDYGARMGKVLLHAYGDDVHNRAKAFAAAGSDARMNGCSLPVVIVSGSGNQGMTASLPVLVYAEQLQASREQTVRAVALSDLVTIHLKTGIGRLSAYCGAVSAGAGAGAGVCYLYGGDYAEIAQTVINALAIDSGVICDGAKSSCAAKIATAVEAGLTGMEMTRQGSKFCGGDGILEQGVEETIDNVCDLARVGMRETDEEIIRLMIGEKNKNPCT